MNLRIEENGFRFRITDNDLQSLLQGCDINQHVRVGRQGFSYRIAPVSDKKEMVLEMADSGFCLYVPHKSLECLRDLGRSKEGISVRQDETEISLQVDIKKQLRKAA